MPLPWGRTILLVLAVLALAGGIFILLGKLEGEPPEIDVNPKPSALGKNTSFTVSLEDRKSGLRDYVLSIKQGEKSFRIAREEFPSGVHKVSKEIEIQPQSLGLEDGPASLHLEVRDRSWFGGNPRILEAPVTVDTKPPVLTVESRFHYLNQGGAGMVVFNASEPLKSCGVKVGELWFKGYRGGPKNGWFVLFAIPHDAPPQVSIKLEAEDLAGNRTVTSFSHVLRTKKFRTDQIRLTEEFLQRVLPYFQHRDPGLTGEPIEVFLKVNRDVRAADEAKIKELCKNTTEEFLWSGAFLRMANSKPMAGFADRRSYIWRERIIDEQFHLGVDLASLAMSPVEAANRGRVIFTGELGIYGNTVILDHGCGLFSMYSHLSQISAQVGEILEKGQRLGVSGSTGLAGGDHLHFSIIVGGVFVNPVEWWDPHWIKDNVTEKLSLLK